MAVRVNGHAAQCSSGFLAGCDSGRPAGIQCVCVEYDRRVVDVSGLSGLGIRAAFALTWAAPAGRMALSNYLLQSVVCTLIFYGYGLGFLSAYRGFGSSHLQSYCSPFKWP